MVSVFYANISYAFTGEDSLDLALFLFFFGVLSLIIRASSFDKRPLSPVIFFLLSVFIFIVARPFIYPFFEFEMVEAGHSGSLSDHVYALYVFLAYFSLMSMFFVLLSSPSFYSLHHILLVDRSCSFHNIWISSLCLGLSLLFFGYFLFVSIRSYDIISNGNYLEIAGSSSILGHIKYFFYGKWFSILYIFSSRHKKRFFWASLILFVASFGFLFVGLRGYFVAYFFLFLYFYNVWYSLSLKSLLVLAISLVFLSSKVIEYRLGYDLYDSLSDVVIRTFHQQGATFEVLYGVVQFPDKVSACVEQYGYLSQDTDFGRCVDRSRGVLWEYGGFATSFFAELHYFNYFIALFLTFVFVYFVKVIDFISYYYSEYGFNLGSVISGFLLFSVIPNLVYFARSDAIDFILKFSFSLLVSFLFFILFRILKEASAD
ncbi:O-antigen polysaccharide polymerase Wzy [Marinobacter panjinensis]|nr:O-antigen polysaccharide polymerase Wzy [Marinobacter panjinensis]MCR8913715.1 O-antigen polysaccharide polymerase Wzy [Marinobacter panjinensis]